ncbi:MAG: lipid-A-disaccharide synthase [Pseudomonadota bacterium]
MTPNIYLIATEESGDRLGASLMKALRARLGPDVRFQGVGGAGMQREGLTSLFPISELSIMGVVAVARQLPMILRRIRETTEAVLAAKPAVLVIIDSPDFTQRVARRVRRRDPSIPIVNYVSPTVWAWRPGRAKAMRAYVDHLLALLPFEPQAHRDLGGPPCTYVGHPLFQDRAALRPSAEEAARRAASPPVLLVLPGSRRAEIRHLAETIGQTLARLHGEGIAFEPVLPTVPHVHDLVVEAVRDWPVKPRIVTGDDEKRAAFRIAHAALAKSGTVTLELAIAGVPMITGYKGTAIEAFIARRMVTAFSAILPNLIVGEAVIPEYMQEEWTPERLVPALREVLSDTPLRRRQIEAFGKLDAIMSTGDRSPSERAADIVIAHFRSGGR